MSKGLKSTIIQLFFTFFFVFVVMLLISRDSYMHDLSTHYDSAWFFMCGKSWANGLTPYVDFTDSKGPLLWIIYALGYAVSPHSYIGVFWLSCMAWTATLFFAWRCAAMFLKNECAAFVAMLPVALVGLQPLVHNETRCEDFAMPFVAFIVYSLCSAASIRRWNWHVGMGVGVCIAATAFMKYNITLMLLPFVLLVWAMARRRCRVPFARLFWQGAVGAMVVSVPFIVFFLMKGNLSDFIAEYLLVTLRTTGDTGLVANTMHTILSPLGVYVLILFFATAYSMANMLPCHRKVALLCNALFIALCSINSRQYILPSIPHSSCLLESWQWAHARLFKAGARHGFLLFLQPYSSSLQIFMHTVSGMPTLAISSRRTMPFAAISTLLKVWWHRFRMHAW